MHITPCSAASIFGNFYAALCIKSDKDTCPLQLLVISGLTSFVHLELWTWGLYRSKNIYVCLILPFQHEEQNAEFYCLWQTFFKLAQPLVKRDFYHSQYFGSCTGKEAYWAQKHTISNYKLDGIIAYNDYCSPTRVFLRVRRNVLLSAVGLNSLRKICLHTTSLFCSTNIPVHYSYLERLNWSSPWKG